MYVCKYVSIGCRGKFSFARRSKNPYSEVDRPRNKDNQVIFVIFDGVPANRYPVDGEAKVSSRRKDFFTLFSCRFFPVSEFNYLPDEGKIERMA